MRFLNLYQTYGNSRVNHGCKMNPIEYLGNTPIIKYCLKNGNVV